MPDPLEQPTTDLSSAMGLRSPLQSSSVMPATPTAGDWEVARQVDPGGAARDAARATVKHMRETPFTPLGVALELGGGPGSPLAMAAAPARRAAITANPLRGLSLSEAIAVARSERHLIQSQAREAFVGAPQLGERPHDARANARGARC